MSDTQIMSDTQMQILAYVGAAIVAVIIFAVFRKLSTPRDLEKEVDARGRSVGKTADKKEGESGSLGGMFEAWAGMWKLLRGGLGYMYPVLFLIPYYSIGSVFYLYFKDLWEPWAKESILFFVLIPAAILLPVSISLFLRKNRQDRKGRVPLFFSFSLLVLLLTAAGFEYKQTAWWEKQRNAVTGWVEKKVEAQEAKVAPPSWKFYWKKPDDVTGGNFPNLREAEYKAQLIRDDPAVFEFYVWHEEKPEEIVRMIWDKTTGSQWGTWNQLDRGPENPGDSGRWRLARDRIGAGYHGIYTSRKIGEEHQIDMWLEPVWPKEAAQAGGIFGSMPFLISLVVVTVLITLLVGFIRKRVRGY